MRRRGPRTTFKLFQVARSWSYVSVLVWYDLLDRANSPVDPIGHGLVRADGTLKPAFARV
jgi:hypothetical protein